MNPLPPATHALTSDPLFPSLKRHLIQTTGMSYYSERDGDLANRIQNRLASVAVRDCASYLEILRDDKKGPAELEELIAEITIGETYFFRHQEHFDALRNIVLPELLARNRDRRSLRIWCAGCADGPEVYSLAILLRREMAHKIAGWDVSILGTDINRHALARAREGRFEPWALRATDEDLKRECFAKEGTGWRINPKYKRSIAFKYYNLVEDPIPSPANNINAFDLLVCRNVMIYFEADVTRKMILQFHECLVEGGWLLVGPTEPNMTFFTTFKTVNAPGVTLYQKSGAQDKPVVTPVKPEAASVLRSRPAGVNSVAKPKRAAVPMRSLDCMLADVRLHADRGELTKAAECCEQLLKKDNLNSRVHFYHALVLEQMGRRAEAEPAFRKAIYLDRQCALPHYYLGLLLQSRGELQQATRSFANAIALLELCTDADVLEDADGITVAEMKKLAKMQLEVRTLK